MLSDANYNAKQNETKGTGLKILSPKQTLQRLPIALAQGKAGNNSESLLNEIKQIVYSFHHQKKSQKKYAITQSNLFNKTSCNVWRQILYLWIQKTVKHLSRIF